MNDEAILSMLAALAEECGRIKWIETSTYSDRVAHQYILRKDHSDLYLRLRRAIEEFGQAIIDVGWHLHETLIWVKDTFVLGHCDYHYQHEPIYYGWKGKNRKWYVGRDKSTIFEIPRPKRSIEHPTMKPIELIEAHLENSTRKGDLVLDPFCGSGSTLIACERMARKARCVEIEPAYIAVTLERWHQMTDKMPSLYIKE